MTQAREFQAARGAVGSRDVDLAPLGEKPRRKLLRSAVLYYQANLRQGTHSTKTRGEVSRSERKPWRQKGTGRARAGDFASPLWKGGGVIFGPKPRSYRGRMSAKARRQALRSALFTKFQDGQAFFLSDVNWEKPSTRNAAAALRELGVADGGVLVVLPAENEIVWKSFRNLPRVDVVRGVDVNAFHVLLRKSVVFVEDALDAVLGRLSEAGEKTEEPGHAE